MCRFRGCLRRRRAACVRDRPSQVKAPAGSLRDGARATLDLRASTTRGTAADTSDLDRRGFLVGIRRPLHPRQHDLVIMKSTHGTAVGPVLGNPRPDALGLTLQQATPRRTTWRPPDLDSGYTLVASAAASVPCPNF